MNQTAAREIQHRTRQLHARASGKPGKKKRGGRLDAKLKRDAVYLKVEYYKLKEKVEKLEKAMHQTTVGRRTRLFCNEFCAQHRGKRPNVILRQYIVYLERENNELREKAEILEKDIQQETIYQGETPQVQSQSEPQKPLIGVAASPGITIRDRIIPSGQYAQLIGELLVEEKTSGRSIAEADVVGYWIISGRSRIERKIAEKTDQEGKCITQVLVNTDTPEKCTLVITAIKKAGYTSPSMPITKHWTGIPPSMDEQHENDDSSEDRRKKESELRKRYGYSAAASVSEADRRQALRHAVEDDNGLGLAYVVRWLTHFNDFVKNNKLHTDAIERHKDDLRWLKTTYYNPLRVKHFRFPPL